MIERYDKTQNATVEAQLVERFDKPLNAWVDAEFVRTYDDTAAAWVDKAKKYLAVTVTDNFYNNSGNVVYAYSDIFHCEVKPTSSDILITAALEGNFTNPVIDCLYSFGNSDLCPAIASGLYSHACITWKVKGYLNGSEVASETIANGNEYAYSTARDVSKTVTLNGTFDRLEFVCVANSFSGYEYYGKANTNLDDITVNGRLYEGKTIINS